MESSPLISIVVPIYNGAVFLPRLIMCLQSQTLKDFEVLCIDDLSTDNSAALLKAAGEEDSRFQLIQRTDKGGTAVKGIVYALPYCQGEYFFYLSQDDLLSDDCLALMYDRAIETSADVVLPKMDWFYDDGGDYGGLYPPNGDFSIELSNENAFLLSLNWAIHGFSLRKMELIRKVGFDDLYYNSCEYATRLCFLKSNKVVFSGGTFFYRQNNPQAITKQMRGFTFEVLVTDIRLSWLLLRYRFPISVKRKRVREMVDILNYWAKIYSEQKVALSGEEQAHVEGIMQTAKGEVFKMALSLCWFRMAWKIYKNNRKIKYAV